MSSCRGLFGHEVKWLGDGLMAAFSSAADAVRCAIAMQQSGRRPLAGARLGLRAGMHLDEFHVDGFRYDEISVLLALGGSSGWQFCTNITSTLRYMRPRAIQNAEHWPVDGSIVTPVANGGAGFDVIQHDGLRDRGARRDRASFGRRERLHRSRFRGGKSLSLQCYVRMAGRPLRRKSRHREGRRGAAHTEPRGAISAFGPPMHGLPTSASIVIPANGVVVFARDAGD